jgi:hypothetical protein
MVLFEERRRCAAPLFMACHPVPQPKWGYGVAQKDIHKLQALCEVVQRLIQGGLMGTDLQRTFVSHHVKPLRQQEITMWIYPRLSYPNCPFSTELDDTEINIRIQGVLAHGADQNFGSGPFPLGEGVVSPG